jgi:AraC-like DNA-binding protein
MDPSKVVPYSVRVAGWSSQVARRAHNPKVAGSNPAPAIEADQTVGPERALLESRPRPRRPSARAAFVVLDADGGASGRGYIDSMPAVDAIRAWVADGVLYEDHDYEPGPAAELPRHAHAEYQLGVSFGFPGEYRYRGARHFVPVGTLTILHPGEAHVTRDPWDRDARARYLMMYVPPALLEETGGRRPFFRDPVIHDVPLVRLMSALHAASREAALLHDELRAELIVRLGGARGDDRPPPRARAAVARARAHLEQRYDQGVRLHELAEVAHVSPHRLNRLFRAEIGVPPHRYQLDLRIDRAKRLLARGEPIAAVAADVGFADQAHLTRHFRRLVRLTPGRYRSAHGKNVQDPLVWPA